VATPRSGTGGPPLGFLLASVGFGAGLRFRDLLAPLGLDPRLFAVLRQVAAEEGISQQRCGVALHVAPSRMVAFVDELEAKGLLERRTNPDDRRARALHLTDAGRAVLAQAFAVAGDNEAAVFGGLTAAEQRELRRLLDTVAAALGLEAGAHPGLSRD
jgi:DNA-binding MarR family transcriptional regulator